MSSTALQSERKGLIHGEPKPLVWIACFMPVLNVEDLGDEGMIIVNIRRLFASDITVTLVDRAQDNVLSHWHKESVSLACF